MDVLKCDMQFFQIISKVTFYSDVKQVFQAFG